MLGLLQADPEIAPWGLGQKYLERGFLAKYLVGLRHGVYSYSVGARCLLCWGVIGLFVTDCAVPMDSLFLVLGEFRPAN